MSITQITMLIIMLITLARLVPLATIAEKPESGARPHRKSDAVNRRRWKHDGNGSENFGVWDVERTYGCWPNSWSIVVRRES